MKTHGSCRGLAASMVRRAAMGLIGLVVLSAVAAAQTGRAARPSSAAAARTALDLGNGAPVLVEGVTGGAISAEVIASRTGPDLAVHKHLGPPIYENFIVEAGLDSRVITDWIAESWSDKVPVTSGRILVADYNGVVQSARSFKDAILTKTTFPALDAASREAGSITLTVVPGSIRNEPDANSKLPPMSSAVRSRWLVANFSFRLGNLETRRISRIESFSIEREVETEAAGMLREKKASSGHVAFPNLRVTFAEADAKSWTAWHKSFVVDGRNGDEYEQAGSVSLLSSDGKTIIATIELSHCGIFRLEAAPVEQGTTSVRRMIADLYCEQMRFEPGAIK